MIMFYISNMLKINPYKHQLMISAWPNFLEGTKNFTPLNSVWPDFINLILLIGVGITATISHIFAN